MSGSYKTVSASRWEKLSYYSPYHFLSSGTDSSEPAKAWLSGLIAKWSPEEIVTAESDSLCTWLQAFLPWDSEFFNRPIYRLFTALQLPTAAHAHQLRTQLPLNGYLFAEVPAADTDLLGALTQAGGRLVETRLHFFRPLSQVLPTTEARAAVRAATEQDVELIQEVAQRMRNAYDRFHAEPAFSAKQATAFLGHYAAACVRGYASTVLVPDVAHLPVASFLALSHEQPPAGLFSGKVSRVVLTAAAPENRGWHVKLLKAAIEQSKAAGSQYLLMTTQAANRAVMHNAYTCGFELGNVSHILSFTA